MVTITVDCEKCNGDGVCVTVCPNGVYELKKKNGSDKSEPVNKDMCIVCGVCIDQCPQSAIKITP